MKFTTFKKPSVELIKDFDAKKDAWIISRPHLDHTNLDIRDLEAMDLPLNGFAHYVFHVNSSLLFRDILFTLRPVVVWAKSNRTTPMNPDNMFISGEYENSIHADSLQYMFEEMYDEIEDGIPQDFAKKKLPMAANTEFTISIDDRTLVAFLNLLRLHSRDLYEAYGKLFLQALGRPESYVTDRHTVDIYPKLALTPEEFDAVGTTDEHLESFIGVYEISNNLMSQFIRQHYSTVKNSLYNMINDYSLEGLTLMTCESQSTVALYADRSSFKKVLSVRSCWFGQWDKKGNDSWSAILDPYVDKMDSQEFAELLPCGGCASNCKIYEDMKPRIQAGKKETVTNPDGSTRVLTGEVNPPCPILLEKPDLVDFREDKYGSNSGVISAWRRLIEDDIIKDNFDNEDRIKYEHNVKTYGLPE